VEEEVKPGYLIPASPMLQLQHKDEGEDLSGLALRINEERSLCIIVFIDEYK